MKFMLILLLVWPTLVRADDFGRLFTSPAERRQLDAIRAGRTGISNPEEMLNSGEAQPEIDGTQPLNIKFSGYIRRPDGEYVIWINGKSALSRQDIPVNRANFSATRDQVTLSTDRSTARMKPGQVWSLEQNVVYEGYNSQPAP